MKRLPIIIALAALLLLVAIPGRDQAASASFPSGLMIDTEEELPLAGPEMKPDPAAPVDGDACVIKPGDSIEEALNGQNGIKRLILSEGEYPIDSSIRVSDAGQLIIEGRGEVSVIGSRIDFPIFIFENCDDVVLKNIHAVHINDAAGDPGQFEKPEGSVLYLDSCGVVIVNGCELEGCGVYGIYAVDTSTIDITGCWLHNNSWRALGIVNRNSKTLVTIRDSNISQNAGFIEASENECTLIIEDGSFIEGTGTASTHAK